MGILRCIATWPWSNGQWNSYGECHTTLGQCPVQLLRDTPTMPRAKGQCRTSLRQWAVEAPTVQAALPCKPTCWVPQQEDCLLFCENACLGPITRNWHLWTPSPIH